MSRPVAIVGRGRAAAIPPEDRNGQNVSAFFFFLVHWRGLESSGASVFLLDVQDFCDVRGISRWIFCILLYSKLVAVQTILQ